jgi:hypothetical protein
MNADYCYYVIAARTRDERDTETKWAPTGFGPGAARDRSLGFG